MGEKNSECGKMRTRKNPNTDTFYAVCSTFLKNAHPAEIPFKTEHFDIKDWQVFRKTKDLKTIYLFFNLFFHSLDTKKMV